MFEKSGRLRLERADIVLNRPDPHFMGDDQAFQMLATVDQPLGQDGAVLAQQHGEGQARDPVGEAQLGRVDLRYGK